MGYAMTLVVSYVDGVLAFLPPDGSAPVWGRADATWVADQLAADRPVERRRPCRTLAPREPYDQDANDRALLLVRRGIHLVIALILAAGLFAGLSVAAFLVRG
jgi:hypothetical protein